VRLHIKHVVPKTRGGRLRMGGNDRVGYLIIKDKRWHLANEITYSKETSPQTQWGKWLWKSVRVLSIRCLFLGQLLYFVQGYEDRKFVEEYNWMSWPIGMGETNIHRLSLRKTRVDKPNCVLISLKKFEI